VSPGAQGRIAPGRIARRFEALRAERRAGLIVYALAGDPDPETSAKLIKRLAAAGADLIEIGLPAARPVKDGAFIRAAHRRARAAGVDEAATLKLVRKARKRDPDVPLVLMGYRETVRRAEAAFFKAAAKAGADAVLIADADIEWLEAHDGAARAAGLDLIRLVTPDDDDAALARLLRGAHGFVYYATVAGPTGGATAAAEDLERALAKLRGVTTLPVAAGFGIKSPDQAAAAARHADAVVVGSALTERVTARLGGAGGGRNEVVEGVLEAVRALAGAIGQSGS